MKGPFLKSKNKTSMIMIHLLIALLPIIIFTIYKNGYIPYSHGKTDFLGLIYPFIFIMIAVITSFITELLVALICKKDLKNFIKNSYSIFPGLFLSLILPINTPILVLIMGVVFASVIGKALFGGFGNNIFNPALVGYIFIVFAYASVFNSNNYLNNYEIDAYSRPTPLTNLSISETISYDELVKPYGSLNNFLVGTIPGSLGETSAILCILGFLYLSFMKVIKWRIPLVYVTTVFVMNYFIGSFMGEGIYYPLFQILSGGLLFGAVFMATDPVTTPVTPFGQILAGIFMGIVTVLLRANAIEGVATSILAMNMLVFIFDKIGFKSRFNRQKIILSSCLIITIMTISILLLSAPKTDENFKIISKNNIDNQTVYIATQKGNGGNIKGKVIIENGKIVTYEIIEHNETDSYYKLVTDSNYIGNLLNNQNQLASVDTVSSATITSKAIKTLLINVMEDYR